MGIEWLDNYFKQDFFFKGIVVRACFLSFSKVYKHQFLKIIIIGNSTNYESRNWLQFHTTDKNIGPISICFPGGSDGKESACNAGDLGSIPGLGRSPEEGNGYPFQYRRSDSIPGSRIYTLEEGMATHFSILAWRIPWTKEPGGLQPMRLQRVGHKWSDWAQHSTMQ